MASRKPKPPEPKSYPHPLKLSCSVCGAEPFLLCVENGSLWADAFKGWHTARLECCLIEMMFEEE